MWQWQKINRNVKCVAGKQTEWDKSRTNEWMWMWMRVRVRVRQRQTDLSAKSENSSQTLISLASLRYFRIIALLGHYFIQAVGIRALKKKTHFQITSKHVRINLLAWHHKKPSIILLSCTHLCRKLNANNERFSQLNEENEKEEKKLLLLLFIIWMPSPNETALTCSFFLVCTLSSMPIGRMSWCEVTTCEKSRALIVKWNGVRKVRECDKNVSK